MEIICTPDIDTTLREDEESLPNATLSETSKEIYLTTYKSFQKWKQLHSVNTTAESVMLLYFKDLLKKYKPTSLWTIYSMLKSTINLNENVNIERFDKLQDFLKEKYESFQPKQAKIFSPDDIKRFLKYAPDSEYLAVKVVSIMRVVGGCHSSEIYKMKISDIQDLNTALLVSIPAVKTRKLRKFKITDRFYAVCKKYLTGRNGYTNNYVFHQYKHGKIMSSRIGSSNLSLMGRTIATYLNLEDSDMYSWYSFRTFGSVYVDEVRHIATKTRLDLRKRDKCLSACNAEVAEETVKPTWSNVSFKESRNISFTFNFNDKTVNSQMLPNMTFKNCSITINNTR